LRDCCFRFSESSVLSINYADNRGRQVCVVRQGAKNLAAATEIKTVTGDLERQKDVNGKIVKYMAYIENQGYKSAKNRVSMIRRLVALGADLDDPESVKRILKDQEKWTDGYKVLMVYAYESYLKIQGGSWERPRYKQKILQKFIPSEAELDALITGTGKQLGTFLQGLKDTGADPGELAQVKWTDLSFESKKVNLTGVKGHKSRYLDISLEFIRRLGILPRKRDYVFSYVTLRGSFQDARKRLARKLNNPRLMRISFTTFRHWKGTMEYHRTRDILYVKELLGHKKVESTMIYIDLEKALFNSKNDEFHSAVAKTAEDVCKLVEAGFEYVTG